MLFWHFSQLGTERINSRNRLFFQFLKYGAILCYLLWWLWFAQKNFYVWIFCWFHFRSPSCMAISRSYPRHFFKFREHLVSFISFESFKKMHLFLLHLVICPVIGPVICLAIRLIIPKWSSPLFSLVLPVITVQYIKSFDGDL